MTRVFYSEGKSEVAPEVAGHHPSAVDSEADTDIEPGVAMKHPRDETDTPTPGEPAYKRLRPRGSVIVRTRQPSKELRDSTGQRLLQRACARGDIARVVEILAEKPNLEDRDYAGTTALHSAAMSGHYEVVNALLKAGAVPDVRSGSEELDTPLMDAAANGFLNVVKLLLDFGADPRTCNAVGRRAIDFALDEQQNDNSETMQSIVEVLESRTRRFRKSGLDVVDSPKHIRASPQLFPPGFTAVQRAPPPVFLDVSRRNVREEVIQHAAEGDLPYVGLALERGWQPTAKALALAAKYGHSEVVGLLLAFGMDPNAEYEGNTALQNAVSRDNIACARLLIDGGASLHGLDRHIADLPDGNELKELVMRSLKKDTVSAKSESVETKPETKAESVESKPQTRAESVETKPESKPESKQDTKAETKPDTKPESKSETKPETKPETKAESKPVEIKPTKSEPAKIESVKKESTKKGPTKSEPKEQESAKPTSESENTAHRSAVLPEPREHTSDRSVSNSRENSVEPKEKDAKEKEKAWAERTQLAELKEKQRRDREEKMLQSLRKRSPSPTPPPPPPPPEPPVVVEASVSSLPYALRQLAYTGTPQDVGPLYTHSINGEPYCIDVQAALALGEPRLQRKHTLRNMGITAHDKQQLWPFCQIWLCRRGASTDEIRRDKHLFYELKMCWVPLSAISSIAESSQLPLPKLVGIRLSPAVHKQPKLFVAGHLPLAWRFCTQIPF